MAQDNLSTNLGKGILDFLYGASKPVRMVNQAAVDIPQILQSLITGKAPGAAPNIGAFGLNPQETQKVEQNPVQEGLKSGANAASYAVPFGKGAQGAGWLMNLLTKAVAPGAAVGALQGVSQDNATPESVLGNTALGGIGAGALHGILNVPGAVIGKTGKTIENLGNVARQNVDKIEVSPSIYGAGNEHAIQDTLKKLNITGSAQSKYQQLLPKYQQLSDQIEQSLSSNPKNVGLDSIKKDLYTNLSQRKTLDLTGGKAKDSIDNFVKSLYDSGQENPGQIYPKDISTQDLFKIKQNLNADYGTIKSKLQNGQPLTDTEKVLSVARKTIDDIIANAHPDVKQFTTMQSHLYDAADSLAKSRGATSNLPMVGKMIPSNISQGGTDWIGRLLQGGGGVLQTGNKTLTNPILNKILGRGASGLAVTAGMQQSIGNNNNENGQPGNPVSGQLQQGLQNQNGISNNVPTNGASNQSNQDISQQGQNSNSMQITPQMVEMAYLKFPKIKADKVAQAYNAQFAGGKAPDQINSANATDGLKGLGEIQSMLQQDPNVLAKKVIPGPVAGKYKAAETQLLTNFVYLKTGKQVNPSELKNLRQLLPQAGDSQETIQYKLGIFKNFYEQVQSGQ